MLKVAINKSAECVLEFANGNFTLEAGGITLTANMGGNDAIELARFMVRYWAHLRDHETMRGIASAKDVAALDDLWRLLEGLIADLPARLTPLEPKPC